MKPAFERRSARKAAVFWPPGAGGATKRPNQIDRHRAFVFDLRHQAAQHGKSAQPPERDSSWPFVSGPFLPIAPGPDGVRYLTAGCSP